jgi:hypothetical protein
MELYKHTGEFLHAIQIYQEAETDEQLALAEHVIDTVQLSFQEKAVAVAHHILNLKADSIAIGNEIERLQALESRAKKSEEWFKRYIQSAMESTQTDKIETPTLKLTIQNNPPSVVVDDESLLPDTYRRIIPAHCEVDKKKIAQTWKDGLGVVGTHIEQKKSLRIK